MSSDKAGSRVEVDRFVARFDRREFWLAHEELEPLWLATREPFLHGCILLAAGCLHAERGNRHGAEVKIAAALECFHESASCTDGFDTRGLRGAVVRLLEQVRASGAECPAFPALASLRSGPSTAELPGAELPRRVRRHAEGYRTGRDPKRRD